MDKKSLLTLFKKEVYYNYLISPLGYIFAALFSVISIWLFIQDLFLINQASLSPLFSLFPFLLLFFLPAITMNLFAEEKKSKTWEILLTLPTGEKEIVLSKFLSALVFAIFSMLMTIPLVVVVGILGTPDWGTIISSYLGVILLIACYISLGIFFSSLTKNPIVSFLGSISFLLVNFFLGQENTLSRLPVFLAKIISYLGLTFHYNSFTQGRIPIYSLVFFVSWIFIFLWLTIVSLKSRDY
ncbi:MAG: ABC transporter permease subunit [Patescibacteria group bacterium]|nr:ABC transporter permease [Patescibacteria group bacterium]